MGVVDDVQRKLFEARCREQGNGPQLRASTMTHVARVPPVWLRRRGPAGARAGGREVRSEVLELRLPGASARHPGSLVLPLLISDLPAFCRWRGRPDWNGQALDEIVDVCDRFVVDSNEWQGVPGPDEPPAPPLHRVGPSPPPWRPGRS